MVKTKKKNINNKVILFAIALVVVTIGVGLVINRAMSDGNTRMSKGKDLSFTFKKESSSDAGLSKGVYAKSIDGSVEITAVSDRLESAIDQTVNIESISLESEDGYGVIDVKANYHHIDIAHEKKTINPRAIATVKDRLKTGAYVVRLELVKVDNPYKPDTNKKGEMYTTATTLP